MSVTLDCRGGPAARRPRRCRAALGEELVWFVGYIHHHEGEDRELYPRLLTLDPGLADLVARMGAEHAAVLPALDDLRQVADRYRAGAADGEQLRTAILALERVLLPHLEQEERDAMPHVARLLTDGEWRELTQRAWLAGLPKPALARMGLWVLDGQPAEHAALMESELSRPEVMLLKTVFGPGHRRRFRRLWGGTPAAEVRALSAEARAALGAIGG